MCSPAEPAGDQERCQQLYDEHRKQTWDDIQSETDKFDQSLLTLSSGILALSLAFIKDIVPLDKATHLWLLYVSWSALVVCIISTVCSSQFSIAASKKQLGYYWKFYIERKPEFEKKRSWQSKALDWLTWVSLSTFLAGIVCTVIFCVLGVQEVRMEKGKNTSKALDARTPLTATPLAASSRLEEGRQPLAATPVSPASTASNQLEKGRQPVVVTPVQTPKPPIKKD